MNLLKISHDKEHEVFRLIDQGTITATFSVQRDDRHVYIHLVSASDAFYTLKHLHYLNEQMTCKFHPAWIVMDNGDARFHCSLNGCGYYAKGHGFMKKVDPWRIKLEDRVFDEQGYIIDQGRMQEVPFGWFSTREKGCGWIAVWNLLKINGQEPFIEDTVHGIGDHSLLGEVMGADIFSLRRYLDHAGLHTRLTLPSDKDVLRKLPNAASGILLYHHAGGAHYCAFQKEGNNMHFYNAVYGRRNHVDSLEHFLKTYAFLPFSMALYL